MFLKGLVVTGEGLGITTAVNLLPLFILVVFLFNETLSATPLLVSLIQGDNNFCIAPLALWAQSGERKAGGGKP